ncbi:dUTPase [Salipaludibacillus neizhouensis]|uniref:dUTPase n=1 Tax=Salipaludibacillus neizhouensis TaxID=885475 RepID=A0A3A9KGG0_9BACI|nr:dUTP diphosphatase [Salipaludibacillus neizhouensis]RKL66675.1 dUTPase [Salipaludibacillus neizhouensis]
MNFKEMFLMQKKLDKYIEDKHLLSSEPLLERKIMAFQVEVAELINETRCFKFWSEKGPSEREVILEEYVDGIHFLLSTGIELNFNDHSNYDYPEASHSSDVELVGLFFEVIDHIQRLRKEKTRANYEKLFLEYLNVGASLGFTEGEIGQAYMQKNEVNHTRQDEGY